jgi:TIR domain
MTKKLVFISHITEEKSIAAALKALIEKTFQNLVTVFVSSDPTSNPIGGQWLDAITGALKECAVEIILISPESIKRPWINFEAGCGWIRGVPVIPLCHSGMDFGRLPAPLNRLNGALATDESQLKNVFPAIAGAVESALPPADLAPFIAAVREYEANSLKIREQNAKSPLAPTDGLSSHEFATLVGIAEEMNGPGDDVSVSTARTRVESLGVTKIAFSLAMVRLEQINMIRSTTGVGWNGNDYPALSVTPEGWAWLESNKDRLALSKRKPKTVAVPPDDEDPKGGDIPF